MEKTSKKHTVFLHAGHGGNDRGAQYGKKVERDINIKIVKKMTEFLNDYVEVRRMQEDVDDVSHSAKQVTVLANAILCELNIDVHCNSGGGRGFECYVGKSGLLDDFGNKVCLEMSNIGCTIRGVKTRLSENGSDYYYFIRDLKNPSTIFETAFLDNEFDIDLTQDSVIEMVARAYSNAILDYFNIKTEQNSKTEVSTMYCVQCGAFKVKSNAEKLKQKLISDGYKDTFIVTKK
ncbi:MAG: N-acetylmuramoyl-L-alanine amidase [Candidatus Gastranaerophilales bacterium]|nr:N-acetylmuramoyl-L-alanine amidase [Candidatus Gastranaerophilales bacterium]